jgi:hypothetical protein
VWDLSILGAKQFVAKLKPDLSEYVYSTTFGSAAPNPNISPVAFLVDRCENVMYPDGAVGYMQIRSIWIGRHRRYAGFFQCP